MDNTTTPEPQKPGQIAEARVSADWLLSAGILFGLLKGWSMWAMCSGRWTTALMLTLAAWACLGCGLWKYENPPNAESSYLAGRKHERLWQIKPTPKGTWTIANLSAKTG